MVTEIRVTEEDKEEWREEWMSATVEPHYDSQGAKEEKRIKKEKQKEGHY